MCGWGLLLSVTAICAKYATPFHVPYSNIVPKRRMHLQTQMIFDFIKQRSVEGLQQVSNFAEKTLEGKIGEAFSDSAQYVLTRQRIDAENLKRLREGLSKSRERLLGGISSAFKDRSVALDTRLEKLEEVLLQADIGVATTRTIIQDLRSYASSFADDISDEDIVSVLRERLLEALTPPSKTSPAINFAPMEEGPTVIFVIGANGMGKTTSIGKLASRFAKEGNMTVLLGACDTFRAAAVEQLAEWAVRANVSIELPIESERGGGDPVPVVERTLRRAVDGAFDVVIVDTSGRLSNNMELVEQLQSMKAAIQRVIPKAPHETLLVVDGSVGRNAVDQAKAWLKYVGVTGLLVTKLDGTARGGFIVSVVKELGIPIKLIGVGEKITDLKDFSAQSFVDALLGTDPSKAQALKLKANKIFNIPAMDALVDSTAMKQQSSDTMTKPSDPKQRLKALFDSEKQQSQGAGSSSDEDGSSEAKKKRKPRPKPQALVQKQKQKQKNK